jgi:hypothetical protein
MRFIREEEYLREKARQSYAAQQSTKRDRFYGAKPFVVG